MTVIDYETAVADVAEIVKGHEDYIYVDPFGIVANDEPGARAKCMYFDPETKQPSCIVGHLFAKYDVEYEDIKDHNDNAIYDAMRDTDLYIKSDALYFLEKVQEFQDAGVSWGESFKRGINTEHGGF